MTNSALLREKIKASGLKMSVFYEKLGISSGPLKKKIDGLVEFKASEINKLKALLSLSQEDIVAIFFAEEVDK